MKSLIIYGTTDGQTRKICEFIQQELSATGHEVILADAKDVTVPNGYDSYIIAASVHLGGYQKSVKRLIKNYYSLLNEKPSIFISVSLTAAGDNVKERADLESITQGFLQKTRWKPKHTLQVAGALRYSQYGFFTKLVMKQIAKKNGGGTDTSHDYEYTDWEQVKHFVQAFAKDYDFVFD